MADQNRTDAMKATNASLTSPQQDEKRDAGRDYPAAPHGREQVRTGSAAGIGSPGYAAPPGRDIDRDADPAANPDASTASKPAATDLDEGANPDAGLRVSAAATRGADEEIIGAMADPDRASEHPNIAAGVAPGAASMAYAPPNGEPTRYPGTVDAGRDPAAGTGATGSAGAAARETNDPNFSAASPGNDRVTADTGTTRMATGGAAAAASAEAAAPIGNGGRAARTAADVMTRDLEVANPASDLYYVARMMADRDTGIVPVVDSTDTMKLVGVITDRDIVVRVVARNNDPKDLRAADCMSAGDLLTARPGDPLDRVLDLMERRQVRRIPVVDPQGRLVGIVSQADLVLAVKEDRAGELVQQVSAPGH
jgi:CBS domain-containing protein